MSDQPAALKPEAILIGHGDFSGGLLSAVQQISGRAAKFVSMSNTGKAPAEIEAALRSYVEDGGIRVIFTDLPAGSATLAARRVAREHAGLVLVTGVNLATLLDFVCTTVTSPVEAARAAADRGKASLVILERC